MAHLTITDVKCHVVDSAAAGVEYKVTRTHLAMTDIVNPEQSAPFVRLVPP